MAKTRAEIQKAYRERKKQSEQTFLKKESLRQAKYRVSADMLSKKKLNQRRSKNKDYCLKYRLKKATEKANKDTVETEMDTTERPVCQSDDISSSCQPSTSTPRSCEPSPSTSRSCEPSSSNTSTLVTRSSPSDRLYVRLPFPVRTPASKRSKALKRANNRINKLKKQLNNKSKLARRYKKRFDRLSQKCQNSQQTSPGEIPAHLTPRSKTAHDLRADGISPRHVPRKVVRRLELGNAVFSEIQSSYIHNTSQRQKLMVNRVISGRIIKKYRFISRLNKETGSSRRCRKQDITKTLSSQQRTRQGHLKSKLTKQVLTYFERDDISRCMPGKRDCANVNGEKKQVRILNDYLRNLHERFLIENPEIRISFSAFCKLRPANIRLTCLLSRNKCLCTKHQNMAMKLKCLLSLGIQVSPNPDVVVRSMSKDQMLEKVNHIKDSDSVEYEEWRAVEIDGKRKMRIVKVKETNFKEKMIRQYQDFVQHTQRVTAQYKALYQLKENLPENHVIVQMDFAENFVCQTMDEIQSAYWNATAVSIHPVVMYFRNSSGTIEHANLAFVSDVNQHNSTAVYTIIKRLTAEIKSKIPDVTSVHYWTDSPTSQYRNRFIFSILGQHKDLFGVYARWNYFEAGHGKGPCDGIGGTCKRTAAQAVKQGKVTIQDAHDFYKWASQNQKTIQYFFYTQNEYDIASKELSDLDTKSIPGTLKLHAVQTTGDGKLYSRTTSCYCIRCLSWTEPCDEWIQHTLHTNVIVEKAHVTLNPPNENEDSAAQENNILVEKANVTSNPPNENEDSAAKENNILFKPHVNQIVAATYDNNWYIGKVVEVDHEDSDAFVSFMSKHIVRGKLQLQWPRRPDEIWVAFADIITEVSEPISMGRSMRYFTLSTFDMQLIENLTDLV